MRIEAVYWLEQGKRDLESARKILDIGIYYVSAFYCHQAVEKVLKAAIMEKKRIVPPQDHNIKRLLFELEENPPQEIVKAVTRINPFYFVSRYPDAAAGLPSEMIDKELAKELVNYAEMVVKWVESYLKK